MSAVNKKQYVQFSKRIVVAVVAAQFVLCAAALLLILTGCDASAGAEVIRANVPFATVVFAAYTGNSAVEKWLIHTAKGKAGGEGGSSNG